MTASSTEDDPDARFRDYFYHGIEKVEGWLQPDALLLTFALHRRQRSLGQRGSVAEIGVHHGRSYIGLGLLCSPDEIPVAIDIFEAQHLNPDGSGRGNRAIFEAHLTSWGLADRTVIIQGDSRILTAQNLLSHCGPVRFFSVDGAHVLEYVLSDTTLAAEVLAPGGVVLLDDYMNPDWPDVTEAVFKLLQAPEPILAPIAVAGGKIFLVTPAEHASWIEYLERAVLPFTIKFKRVQICGWRCFVTKFGGNAPLGKYFGKVPLAFGDFADGAQLGLLQSNRGWSIPEKWGRWTEGPRSWLDIALPAETIPRELLILCSTLKHAQRNQQVVSVTSAGREIGTFVANPDQFSWSSLKLPPQAGPLSVCFNVSDCRSPAELGASSDSRNLGISFRRAVIYGERGA